MRCDFQKCSIRSVGEFRIAQNSPYVRHSLADVFEIGALGDLLDDLVVALVAVTPVSPSWAESQHVDGEVLHEVVLGLPMRFELGVVAILLLPILGHLQCIRVEQCGRGWVEQKKGKYDHALSQGARVSPLIVETTGAISPLSLPVIS